MSASVNDLVTDTRNAARPNSARVTSGRSAGGSTLACDNLSGWPTASKVHFVTYTVDTSSNPVAGTQLDCYGIVSGNNITSFTVVDGSDSGNQVGDYVEMLPTAAWGQDLSSGLLASHNRDGTPKTGITYPASTFTSPTLNTPSINSPAFGGTATGSLTSAILSNPYKFSVYRSAAFTTANSFPGAIPCVFDTKLFDTGNNFSTTTGLFTAPIAGFYLFSAMGGSSSIATGTGFGLNYIKNGSAITGGPVSIQGNTGGFAAIASYTDILQLSANDTVGVNVYASAGAGATGQTSNNFSGFLLSPT